MNFFFFLLVFILSSDTQNFQSAEILFFQNCAVCHPTGTNLILPEKNLKKESLQANGMNSKSSILYQVRNGKNGMPAFADRFKEKEIQTLAEYILFQSEKNFENQSKISLYIL
jgi:cytochrome c6